MTESLFESTDTSGWDIASAREDLASKLDGLRDRPGFPLGDDEAIVALSLPPFHTACPNPYIEDWLGEAPSDDADREDPGPYVTDITVGKGNAFYKAHSYPTKVPYQGVVYATGSMTKLYDLYAPDAGSQVIQPYGPNGPSVNYDGGTLFVFH